MYQESAEIYDAIYSWKDYRKEAELIHRLIRRHKRSDGISLLDVACGTGSHIAFLKRYYEVEGLDINPRMLREARRKNPGVQFLRGDMRTFDLARQFDVVTCLFGSICFMPSLRAMREATRNMARHVRPGGLLIIEPFITPEAVRKKSVHAVLRERKGIKVARMHVSVVRGRVLEVPSHFLVGTPHGVRHFVEKVRYSLFHTEEHFRAFKAAGLRVRHYAKGPMGRGVCVGMKPRQERQK